ncbi:hypothetical protein NXS98_00820 [Fontisphaera persica]|uniref:hypothetical protein n=1 Tax=Fontisphaera persica TaxID=2974023 RepID=UPI0024C0E0FE|nr:hypothetical protein [Fontisphaera persica]WCJ59692.1 hypothetical protein NXS98_00820 [Fontisphaera persica]
MEIFGYVDPGSGALIWQMLAAAAVGVLFYFRSFFRGIGRFFQRLFGKSVGVASDAAAPGEVDKKT